VSGIGLQHHLPSPINLLILHSPRLDAMKKTGIDVPKSIQLASLLLGSEPGRARRLFSRCGAF